MRKTTTLGLGLLLLASMAAAASGPLPPTQPPPVKNPKPCPIFTICRTPLPPIAPPKGCTALRPCGK